MNITYLKKSNRYVDSHGRVASTKEYGKDFYNCKHDFVDTGNRGTTQGPNGKYVPAAAHQCSKCGVYMVVEVIQQ
jgi:hypothetical protein